MYNLDDIKLDRINVKIEHSVKEWYQYKARCMGMSMSQLMSYILTNYHDTQVNAETLKGIKDIAYDDALKMENKAMLMELLALIKENDKDGNVK